MLPRTGLCASCRQAGGLGGCVGKEVASLVLGWRRVLSLFSRCDRRLQHCRLPLACVSSPLPWLTCRSIHAASIPARHQGRAARLPRSWRRLVSRCFSLASLNLGWQPPPAFSRLPSHRPTRTPHPSVQGRGRECRKLPHAGLARRRRPSGAACARPLVRSSG